MGLFSRHHSPARNGVSLNGKIYVYAHCTGTTSSATTTWSIAVSEKNIPPSRTPSHDGDDDNHEKRKRPPLFSFHSHRHSRADSDSEPEFNDDSTVVPDEIQEFSLSSGALIVTHHPQPSTGESDNTNNDVTNHAHSNAILLKILLPHPHNTPIHTRSKSESLSSQPLSAQIHSILAATTQEHANQSHHWLLTALLTLQQLGYLPPIPGFTTTRFLAYAENNLIAIRQEIIRGTVTGTDSTPSTSHQYGHVREADYAAHLAENDRLRAHFGHESATSSPVTSPSASRATSRDRGGRDRERESQQQQQRQSHYGVNGDGSDPSKARWWVTRPMNQTTRRFDRDRGNDVYAGLM